MDAISLPRVDSSKASVRVFISHTSSDKDTLVRPLVRALQEHGVDPWFDEGSMRPGDSLVRSIDRGLIDCDFAVIVLSPEFMKRTWPEYEFVSLMSRELHGGRKVVIPVWFNVTRDEVASYSLALADKLAITATGKELFEVAREILAVVRPSGMTSLRAERMIRERSSGEMSTVRLDKVAVLPVPAGPVSLAGRDAVSAILAELTFPYLHASDIDGMFADLSKEPHPQTEILVHQILAACYLLTLQTTSGAPVDDDTRRRLRQYILCLGSGIEADPIARSLPENLVSSAKALLDWLNSVGHSKEVVVTSRNVNASTPKDSQVRNAALVTKWFGSDSESIREALHDGLLRANEMSEAGDFGAAADIYLALELLALQLEGIKGDLYYRCRANHAYYLGMAGSPLEAVDLFREVRAAYLELNGPSHEATESAHSNVADFLGRAGLHMEACLEYEALLDQIEADGGIKRERYKKTKNGLAHSLLEWLDARGENGQSEEERDAYIRMAPKAFGHREATRSKKSRRETSVSEGRGSNGPPRHAPERPLQQELF